MIEQVLQLTSSTSSEHKYSFSNKTICKIKKIIPYLHLDLLLPITYKGNVFNKCDYFTGDTTKHIFQDSLVRMPRAVKLVKTFWFAATLIECSGPSFLILWWLGFLKVLKKIHYNNSYLFHKKFHRASSSCHTPHTVQSYHSMFHFQQNSSFIHCNAENKTFLFFKKGER